MSSLAARLQAHVRYLAQTIGERHYLRPAALTATALYIEEQLRATGASVTKHEFFVSGRSFVNLEVLVPRADSSHHEPACLVVGAHYDTVPGTPGADDNASGVAALIELVQQLGREHFVSHAAIRVLSQRRAAVLS